MGTTATAIPVQQLTLEEKIDQAALKASAIVNQFSPSIGNAIAAGAEVEPLIKGLVQMFIALFHHNVKQPSAGQ